MIDNGLKGVLANLNKWKEEKYAGIEAVSKNTALTMVRYSKRKDVSKWHDRTSHARQGLKGGSFWDTKFGKKINSIIWIGHSVDYGVYLELAHEKRFAVLWPVVKKFENAIRGKLKRIMEA